jgi:hypothetical protein
MGGMSFVDFSQVLAMKFVTMTLMTAQTANDTRARVNEGTGFGVISVMRHPDGTWSAVVTIGFSWIPSKQRAVTVRVGTHPSRCSA